MGFGDLLRGGWRRQRPQPVPKIGYCGRGRFVHPAYPRCRPWEVPVVGLHSPCGRYGVVRSPRAQSRGTTVVALRNRLCRLQRDRGFLIQEPE